MSSDDSAKGAKPKPARSATLVGMKPPPVGGRAQTDKGPPSKPGKPPPVPVGKPKVGTGTMLGQGPAGRPTRKGPPAAGNRPRPAAAGAFGNPAGTPAAPKPKPAKTGTVMGMPAVDPEALKPKPIDADGDKPTVGKPRTNEQPPDAWAKAVLGRRRRSAPRAPSVPDFAEEEVAILRHASKLKQPEPDPAARERIDSDIPTVVGAAPDIDEPFEEAPRPSVASSPPPRVVGGDEHDRPTVPPPPAAADEKQEDSLWEEEETRAAALDEGTDVEEGKTIQQLIDATKPEADQPEAQASLAESPQPKPEPEESADARADARASAAEPFADVEEVEAPQTPAASDVADPDEEVERPASPSPPAAEETGPGSGMLIGAAAVALIVAGGYFGLASDPAPGPAGRDTAAAPGPPDLAAAPGPTAQPPEPAPLPSPAQPAAPAEPAEGLAEAAKPVPQPPPTPAAAEPTKQPEPVLARPAPAAGEKLAPAKPIESASPGPAVAAWESKLDEARELVDAAVYHRNAGEYEKALAMYEEALELAPRYPLAIASVVRVHLLRKDGDKALQWAERLVAMQPNRSYNQLLLGDAASLAGDTDRARAAWEKAHFYGNKTAASRLDK